MNGQNSNADRSRDHHRLCEDIQRTRYPVPKAELSPPELKDLSQNCARKNRNRHRLDEEIVKPFRQLRIGQNIAEKADDRRCQNNQSNMSSADSRPAFFDHFDMLSVGQFSSRAAASCRSSGGLCGSFPKGNALSKRWIRSCRRHRRSRASRSARSRTEAENRKRSGAKEAGFS